MCEQKGNIFNIQRFSTSDGYGIRTVVFLKGCPLDCAWCHNPESKCGGRELFFKETLCIGCGSCAQSCLHHAHVFANGVHRFKRNACALCGNCAKVCPTGALELCGETNSVGEILSVVLRDVPFYQTSGGGLTLSGGEPLLQYDFSLALFKEAKSHALHTAVETSGYCLRDLREITPYVDLWLYDIKLTDDDAHIRYTGKSNRVILDNLRRLSEVGAHIILRCPVIPDVNMNESHFDALAELSRLNGVEQIHIEPYHPLGISKARQLGKVQMYSNETFLQRDLLQPYVDRLRKNSRVEVIVL